MYAKGRVSESSPSLTGFLPRRHCVTDNSFQVPSDFLDNADFTLGLSGKSFLEISGIDKVGVLGI